MNIKLDFDEIAGEYVIYIPDEIIEELDYWDLGDKLGVEVQTTRSGDNVLVIRNKS